MRAIGILPVLLWIGPFSASPSFAQTRANRSAHNPAGWLPMAGGGSCEPHWAPTFGGMPGVDDAVHALTTFDDGSGTSLYFGGEFTIAGNTTAQHIARWDGTSWSALGGGTDDSVHALAVFDDGSGPALYAGGLFESAGGLPAHHVAKWDGVSWSALGSGIGPLSMGVSVSTLAVFDDGSGAALYAGGFFVTAGGVPASHVAKWNGSSWEPLGAGTNQPVHDLAVFDDGDGAALYAGGYFSSAGGVVANDIARWDGSSWSAVGGGSNGGVNALEVFDDGSGPGLYVGGNFWMVGGVPADDIARWDGSNWSPLTSGADARVHSLHSFDDGTGPALYVGGDFTTAGGVQAERIAKWNGASWSALDDGVNQSVRALTSYDDGGGPALYAGGAFTQASGVAARHVGKWDGSSWSGLQPSGLGAAVFALESGEGAEGPALYVGGSFMWIGGVGTRGLASWDGASWTPIGGLDGSVHALEFFDDGGGPELFAGGTFRTAGGTPASCVASWDGSNWSPLGSGVDGNPATEAVYALASFDDGSGPALFVGGSFHTAGGSPAAFVAKWDGVAWSSLSSGFNGTVRALTVFDDGAGPALYAAGDFAERVARWNGSTWTVLGTGLVGGTELMSALVVFDDGTGAGPQLYAGGSFQIGTTSQRYIAKWDGAAWSGLGSGTGSPVRALAVFDDGGGPALYAGGPVGFSAGFVSRWDGANWTALGSGMNDDVLALAAFDDASGIGPGLYGGGRFTRALDSGDSYLARWQGCLDTVGPVLDCPASVMAADSYVGPPGRIVTYSVTAHDVLDPTPEVVCVPPSGSNFPLGTTLVQCMATDDAGNQTTCEFPVTVAPKLRRRDR